MEERLENQRKNKANEEREKIKFNEERVIAEQQISNIYGDIINMNENTASALLENPKTKSELMKNYKKLILNWHPDKWENKPNPKETKGYFSIMSRSIKFAYDRLKNTFQFGRKIKRNRF